MIIADYHLHTHNSGDSTAPMEDMILSAIDKGLSEICFTEHMDMDFPLLPDLPPDPFNLDTDAYQKELLYYREKYKEKITIKFGVEVGMQTQIAKENAAYVDKYNFDFVIASIHLVDKQDPYYPSFWASAPKKEIIRHYFDITLSNLELFDNYDVLGHLDYITRYAPDGDKTYSYDEYSDIIDRILTHLVARDKGLDLNSKNLLSDPSADPNPCLSVLRRFKELGGQIITFGSDAHAPAPIACGFSQMQNIAKSAGFTHYYTFENRTPLPHSL